MENNMKAVIVDIDGTISDVEHRRHHLMAKPKNWKAFNAAMQFLKIKKWSPMRLMEDNKTISGTNMGHLFDRIDLLRPQVDELLRMFESGQLKPHVDRTFRFDEAPLAHQHIHDRKAIGKVLLVP